MGIILDNLSFILSDNKYHVGKVNDKLECTIRKVERKKRWSISKFKRQWANKMVVTYLAIELGEFWIWEE